MNIILYIIVGILIIITIIINIIPTVRNNISNFQQSFEYDKSYYYTQLIDNYVNSKGDYYYKIEGATYCIPVQQLVSEEIITEENVGDNINSIIEADFEDGSFNYKYNNECLEK